VVTRRAGIGIAGKLIIASSALLLLVVVVFGLVSSARSRQLIDAHARAQQGGLTLALQRAGASEARLLARTVRVDLLQNDY